MTRSLLSYALSALLALTGLSFAQSRGMLPEAGVDIVICSGTGVTTITVGPDGQPVQKTVLCPDSTAFLSAALALPSLVPPVRRLVALAMPAPTGLAPRGPVLTPSARDPPAQV